MNVIYISYQYEPMNKIPLKMKEYGVEPKLILDSGRSDSDFEERYGIEGVTEYVLSNDLYRRNKKFTFTPIIEKYLSKNMKMPQNIEDKLFEYFPRFVDQYSRYDDFLTWSYQDYLNNYFTMARFAYNFMVSENIEAVIETRFPHIGIDTIFCVIAKELGIKTIFFQPLFEVETAKLLTMYSNTFDYDRLFDCMKKKRRDVDFKIKTSFKKDLIYMKDIKYFGLDNLKIKTTMLLKLLLYLPRIKNTDKKIKYFDRVRRFWRDKNCLRARDAIMQKPDYSKKYVYFGLHLQPELTTSFLGGKYTDQLLAIEKLSNLLPDDWMIYVKENPKQDGMNRGEMFYQRLAHIPKTQLVPMNANNYELMEHSQFVSSITGTMLYEAVCGGKPALMFGNFWYSNLPGVFKYNENLNVEEIANCKIDHDELQKVINDFYSKCEELVIENYSLEHLLPAEQKFDHEENEQKAMGLLRELLGV